MLKLNHTLYSMSKLLDMYHMDKLIINEHQLSHNFDDTQDSFIIETLLMGIPVNIVCQQQLGGKMKIISKGFNNVIDFFENKRPINILDLYPEIHGKFFNDLDNLYKNILLNSNILIIKTMHNSLEDLKKLDYIVKNA